MEEKSLSSENKNSQTNLEMEFLFPDNYKVEAYLGEGGYGQVFRCFKKDTQETVAVKVPGHNDDVSDELNILRYLQRNHLDKCNIVRFIESFGTTDNRVALVFESLDITLYDYIFYHGDFKGLYLHDIRSVIQQIATALNALKSKGVIHSDIKSDNVMLVDRDAQPISVKLIDFGLAIPAVNARVGAIYQLAEYRAPEIYLGLPFTEAIDMWSLGTLMVQMVLGNDLILGKTRYDKMRRLVELFGVPPDHILNRGLYSNYYFVRTPTGQWRFKTPREYWGFPIRSLKANFRIRSLDELETLSLMNLNSVDADERRECIDLMKAMLRIDPTERITPFEVLNHPFIKRDTVQHSSDGEKPGTSRTKEPGTSKTEEPGTKEPGTNGPEEPEEPGTREPEEPEEPEEPGTREPEEPEEPEEPGTREPEEPEEPEEPGTREPEEPEEPGTREPEEPEEPGNAEPEEPDEPEESNNDVCSTYGTFGPVLPGVMLASSPKLGSSLELKENVEQQLYSCTNGCCGSQESVPASSSPRVILVQSAPPDCCWDLCEDDEPQSESCTNGCCGSQESIPASSSPRVILVESAPPDCCWDLCEDDEPQSESCMNGCCGSQESIPASSSPRVILVESAPPDCCWDLCEDDEPQSESCFTTKLADTCAEYSRKDKSGRPCGLLSAKACDSALAATMSDHIDPETKRKKKKKKNYFKRFFSWMKKTFCSCMSANDDQD